MKDRTYIAIDLKSFYASVECRERGLDPLDTNLVVADESRTDKTICLAVTPSLKSYGISGGGRLFEVKQRVKEANEGRRHDAPGHRLDGSSHLFSELQENPSLAIDFIIAQPRMAYYMEYSTRIYQVYMKYVAPEDIIVYSIDEVFMDVTAYLNTYKLSPHDLAMKIILDVLSTTGITATAGIGTNLYLCKVAMDIVAKHNPADKNGVRIAELDEMSYRKTLWSHQPHTDFWRVGKGYAKKLEENGMFTMGDVLRHFLPSSRYASYLVIHDALLPMESIVIGKAVSCNAESISAVGLGLAQRRGLYIVLDHHRILDTDAEALADEEMAEVLMVAPCGFHDEYSVLWDSPEERAESVKIHFAAASGEACSIPVDDPIVELPACDVDACDIAHGFTSWVMKDGSPHPISRVNEALRLNQPIGIERELGQTPYEALGLDNMSSSVPSIISFMTQSYGIYC